MKCDYPFPDKCEKCIHETVCYMVGECLNHIPDFECDFFEEKRPDATFDLYKDDMYSGGFYLLCTSCKWRFATGAYKILEDDNYCPHCGAKVKRAKEQNEITLTFNVEKIEKIEDARCSQ